MFNAPAYIFYMSGAKKGKIEPARPSGRIVRIGRQPYCEIALDPYLDIPASGEHAQIIVEPSGGFTLRDTNSSWGTFKNDERVSGPLPITTGDVITLGRDDQGRVGPQLKFYLASDILRCRVCEGPVYKRHFKCPGCSRKVCLRCVVVQRRLCKACVLAVPASGSSAIGMVSSGGMMDSGGMLSSGGMMSSGGMLDSNGMLSSGGMMSSGALARPPSGRQPTASGWNAPAPNVPNAPPTKPGVPPHKRTKMMPGAPQRGAPPIPSSGGGPSLPPFPPGGQPGVGPTSDSGFGAGRRGAPAGGRPTSSQFPAGATEPFSGKGSGFRGDSSSGSRPPLPARPPSQRTGRREDLVYSLDRKDPSASEPVLRVPDLADLEAAKGAGGSPLEPGEETKFDVQRPQAIPCERCKAALNAVNFFICQSCNHRLCPSHRDSPGASVCNQCSGVPARTTSGRLTSPPNLDRGTPPPMPRPIPPTMRHARPPQAMVETLDDSEPWRMPPVRKPRRPDQDFIDTADDEDDLARPPPGGGEDRGLAGLRFECPYCEKPLSQHARTCSHCRKDL